MSEYQIVVCGSLVPDPLQTLEPAAGAQGPVLKNEMMLPSVLDPWAGHALYEAANLAKQQEGSKVWLVSLGPKAKLQQLMMTLAQKAPFQLVALDGPAGGFTDSSSASAAIAETVKGIPGLDMSRLLLFGGWESASRGSGSTLQMVGERLGIRNQFQGVDELEIKPGEPMKILERVEGGKHQVSTCEAPPAVFGWATGNLPEPPNNPQIGMLNMRSVMPAIQQARPVQLEAGGLSYSDVKIPELRRQTRIVKDMTPEEVARDIVEWIKE